MVWDVYQAVPKKLKVATFVRVLVLRTVATEFALKTPKLAAQEEAAPAGHRTKSSKFHAASMTPGVPPLAHESPTFVNRALAAARSTLGPAQGEEHT